MKLLCISNVVPFRRDGTPGVTAAHITAAALLENLRKKGHSVTVQCIVSPARGSEFSTAELTEAAWWSENGITMLPPIFLSRFTEKGRRRFRSLRMLMSAEEAFTHYYPGALVREEMHKRAAEGSYDAIVTLWSPNGVAATRGIPIPCVAYHGDIDYLPTQCRQMIDPELFPKSGGRGMFRRFDQRLRLRAWQSAHETMMASVDVIANVTACNVAYYKNLGHARSVYVRNTWPLNERPAIVENDDPSRPRMILGHVGHFDRTGGTYGLRCLLEDVLPRLEERMQGREYVVHVIGNGEPHPRLRTLLQHPRIKRHAFIEDLDAMLRQTDVFCMLNNSGSYKAAYTRHLVAWAMKLCLVAHEGSHDAIPEIVHEKNALLGATPDALADCVARAALDSELNRRLRDNGHATFTKYFLPEAVASALEEQITWAINERR